MHLKGIDKLRRHVPDLRSPRGFIRVGLYLLGWILLVTYYFLLTDQIPTWSIDSQILIMALGFFFLALYFSRKEVYQLRYKGLAYRNAFAHFAVPGLGFIFAAVIHAAYMNGPLVPRGWWTYLFIIVGALLLISGVSLWLRSILTLGFDNLALLYVYFPLEGEMVKSSIYSILRHPVYAGVLQIGIGLALLNGNANALAFAFLMPLGFFGWIRLIEEKELIQRFGESYLEYRKQVPAFWPKLRDLRPFFNFIFTGK